MAGNPDDSIMVNYAEREDQEPMQPKEWLNPVTGQRFIWNDHIERYVPTGEYPFGTNPLDF